MVLNLQILSIFFVVSLIWLIALTVLLVRSTLHYRKLTKNITKKDLKTVLDQVLSQIDLTQQQAKKLETKLKDLSLQSKTHIQKLGFIRYNPFPQTGGNQSFSLSLLDDQDTGFVLSSLHSRDITRLYAKTIKNGQSQGFQLSKEERQAIKNAQK